MLNVKKTFIYLSLLFIAIITAIASLLFSAHTSAFSESPDVRPVATEVVPDTSNVSVVKTASSTPPFTWPIANAENRVTKKPFGLHIDPEHSPIPNDRFTGYHVGVDFETTEDEAEMDVPIFAICDGKLVLKQFAKGYGGLAVQACELNGQEVTIMYGHLNLTSITVAPTDSLVRGQQIGVLGKGYSKETDGVRKHLHLGIHAGSALDIRGYVQTQSETNKWLDALEHMPN